MHRLRKTVFFLGFFAVSSWAQQVSEVTDWKMQDSAAVSATTGDAISASSFDASSWYAATVPGTVLQTLVDRGVSGFENPWYGQNMVNMPDLAAAQKRYWFRSTFNLTYAAGQRVWLEFGGINYFATIFVN